jgi:tyrosyl-tRNA synthetase
MAVLEEVTPVRVDGQMSNIINDLTARGFVSQVTDPKLGEKLSEPMTLYAGFDPTADSLHIGGLLQIMSLAQFQRQGHTPLALVGGATAMIGDPSGKSEERNLLDEATIAKNLAGIRGQLERLLDFECKTNPAQVVNNADWIGAFSYIEFLRDVGKHFRMGEMLGKESVRKRMDSEAGLSYTEFSYQLLQSYDYLHLCREYDCRLQVGGDDQWGNITAGIALVRKVEGKTVYGLTSPLITKSDGSKFGKTESGNVWLDAEKTSPYEFYQYWVRSEDKDVARLLKYFTFMAMDEIAELERLVETEPENREAQKVLAQEVTKLIHGQAGLDAATVASEVLFGKAISGLSDQDLCGIFSDVPSTDVERGQLNEGIELLEALCLAKLSGSRGEAKRQIKAGGIYVNNNRIDQLDHRLSVESLASESMIVLRSGKKKYHLLKFS